jgi:decaprenylphospho-beta-D-erythro-pentofuranosid-2-ulose 2-reductase
MGYILIIGAKSDIAKATARIYAAAGYDLYLAARNATELEPLRTDIEVRSRQTVRLVELDILDTVSHAAIYNSLDPKPDGVITAVGYLGTQEQAQNDYEEAACIMATNYTGVVSFLNIVANDFEERGHGFIVGISSVAGDRGRKSNYLYGSAKAALSTYLSGLRNRLHDAGVQVLTVKPGFVRTQMTEGMELPEKLTTTPEAVAEDIFEAQQKGKSVLYTKWFWRWIMLIIQAIPEWQFKKMSI